jgi:hypothetical protein
MTTLALINQLRVRKLYNDLLTYEIIRKLAVDKKDFEAALDASLAKANTLRAIEEIYRTSTAI